MRADRDGRLGDAGERRESQLRHPQFRRRAAPEQVARRGRDDEHVGTKAGHLRRQFRQFQPLGVRVEDARLVPGLAEQRLGVAVFERQMRLAATEIDAAFERPGRIDERDPHCAACNAAASRRLTSSQSYRSRMPSATPTWGRHPVARQNLALSDTYHRWSPTRHAPNSTVGGRAVQRSDLRDQFQQADRVVRPAADIEGLTGDFGQVSLGEQSARGRDRRRKAGRAPACRRRRS